MLGVLPDVRQRDLVRPERALDRLAVHDLRARPALRRAEHDRRPARPPRGPAVAPRLLLNRAGLGVACLERRREARVHVHRLVAFDETRLVTVPSEQARDLVVAAPAEHRGAGDLVAVEVQDGQDRAVPRRIQEMDPLPGPLERPRLRLAVADHGGDEQIRVVERCPECVDEHVAQLAAFVDRARRRHAHVARHAPRRRELPKESPQAVGVLRDARVDLRIRPFQVHVGQDRGPAVAGAGEVDHIGVGLSDQPIQVEVDEAEPGRRAPVPEQARLDVLGPERLAQERIVLKVDLADRQVVRGAPVGVEVLEVHHAPVVV